MAATLKRLWKNDYFQTTVSIAILIAIFAGFFFGSQIILNTDRFPFCSVSSGSMSIPASFDHYDGLLHPFDRTLHEGDIVIIQGVNPEDLNTNYPNSDIIVYMRNPNDPTDLIIHRIVAKVEIKGILYFYTKGDGNPSTNWPTTPSLTECDSWSPVPANMIVGRVVARIPFFGYATLALASNSLVLPAIIVIIVIIVILEFLLPLRKNKRDENKDKTQNNFTQFLIKKTFKKRHIYKEIRLIQVNIVCGASKRGNACQRAKR